MLEGLASDIQNAWIILRSVEMYPEVIIFSFGSFVYFEWWKDWDAKKASPIAFVAGVIGNLIYTKYEGSGSISSWTVLMGLNIGLITLGIYYLLNHWGIIDKLGWVVSKALGQGGPDEGKQP